MNTKLALGPFAQASLNFKLSLAYSKYTALSIIFYFINFEHVLLLGKLELLFVSWRNVTKDIETTSSKCFTKKMTRNGRIYE